MSYTLSPDPGRPGSYRVVPTGARPGWAHVLVFHLPALAVIHWTAFLLIDHKSAHPVLILLGAVAALAAHWIGVARMPRPVRTACYLAAYGGASIYLMGRIGADWLWTAVVVLPLLVLVWKLGATYNPAWVLPARLRRRPTGIQVLAATAIAGAGVPLAWKAGLFNAHYVEVACFGRGSAEAATYLRDFAAERPRSEVDHNVFGDSIIRIYLGPYEESRAWRLADQISTRTYQAAGERPDADRPCDVVLRPGRPPQVVRR